MIEKRPFGNTGHMSTVTLFGAAALSNVTPNRGGSHAGSAAGIRHQPHRHSSYGNAEEHYRSVDSPARGLLLATKTGERSYEKAKEEIHRSLDRMRIDSFDLIQLHNWACPGEWGAGHGPPASARSGHRSPGAGHR
ncbi:MAG: hypothetical protein R3A10_05360 [Caldilineaceae bacterium]